MEGMDIIIDLLILVSVLILGIVYGWNLGIKNLVIKMLQDPDGTIRYLENYKNKIKDDTTVQTEVIVDKVGEVFYIYSKEENQFLAQGPTIKDALEVVRLRFPGKQFNGLIPKEQAAAWGITKQIEQNKQ